MQKKMINDLEIGDRFYFVNDKQRKIWIIDDFEEITVSYEWQAPRTKKIIKIKDDLFGRKEVKRNQQVVFIRKK